MPSMVSRSVPPEGRMLAMSLWNWMTARATPTACGPIIPRRCLSRSGQRVSGMGRPLAVTAIGSRCQPSVSGPPETPASQPMLRTPNGPFTAGELVVFDILVTNQGTETATSIELTDYIPTGLTLEPGNGWTDNGDGTATFDTLLGPLAPNGSLSVPVSFIAQPGIEGVLTNYAEISAANDSVGAPASDIDSTADADNTNDAGGQAIVAGRGPRSDPLIDRSTIAGNLGTVFYCEGTAIDVRSSIVWGNAGALHDGDTTPEFEYSCVDAAVPPPGDGNIATDPLFVAWGDAAEIVVADQSALDAADLGGLGRRVEHVALAQELLGAHRVQDHAAVDLARHLEGDTCG